MGTWSGVDCRRRILQHVKTDDCTQKTVFSVSRPRVALPNFHFLLFLFISKQIKYTKTQKRTRLYSFSFPVSAHTFVLSPSKFAWISTEFYIQFYFPRAFLHRRSLSPDRRTDPSPQSTSVIDRNS